jgi:hypothetical protein
MDNVLVPLKFPASDGKWPVPAIETAEAMDTPFVVIVQAPGNVIVPVLDHTVPATKVNAEDVAVLFVPVNV